MVSHSILDAKSEFHHEKALRTGNLHFHQGQRSGKVKFLKLEFFNSDCRFGFLAKKYNSKVCFFFLYFDQNTFKFKVKVAKKGKLFICLNLPSFYDFDVEFEHVLMRISKKGAHFAIILFCKESKSAIRIKEF